MKTRRILYEKTFSRRKTLLFYARVGKHENMFHHFAFRYIRFEILIQFFCESRPQLFRGYYDTEIK